jgi:uncharacterized protein (DUF736 family)
MTTTPIGKVCDFDSTFEDAYGKNEIRIWDTESEIRIVGASVTEEDKEKLHGNLRIATIEATGNDDADLTAAWQKIEQEVREYFEGFEVEIDA